MQTGSDYHGYMVSDNGHGRTQFILEKKLKPKGPPYKEATTKSVQDCTRSCFREEGCAAAGSRY